MPRVTVAQQPQGGYAYDQQSTLAQETSNTLLGDKISTLRCAVQGSTCNSCQGSFNHDEATAIKTPTRSPGLSGLCQPRLTRWSARRCLAVYACVLQRATRCPGELVG